MLSPVSDPLKYSNSCDVGRVTTAIIITFFQPDTVT